jgi:hypothetical protein
MQEYKPTLVVSEWLPNGSRQLAAAAQQGGWNVVCLEGKDQSPTLARDDAVYYGGTDLAQQVARRLGLVLLEPPFDWLARLPSKYTQRKVSYATVAEARRLDAPAFVKPADAANKCFDSGVYPGGWAIPERRGFPDSTAVLIAQPVAWEVEYRCFLLDGEVMTFAPYARVDRWVRSRDGQWVIPQTEIAQAGRGRAGSRPESPGADRANQGPRCRPLGDGHRGEPRRTPPRSGNAGRWTGPTDSRKNRPNS